MEITNALPEFFEIPEHTKPDDLAKTSDRVHQFFNSYGLPIAVFAVDHLSPYRSVRCIVNGVYHLREGNAILASADALELASCVWLPLRIGSLSVKGVYYLHQVAHSDGLGSLPSSYKLVRVSDNFFRLIPRLIR